ncbi:hypothetical protein C3V43_04960 [Bacteroides heparinolyticus]|nr:hypothetical protein C3V43_04960 [Bacteroides heparinolyticus]
MANNVCKQFARLQKDTTLMRTDKILKEETLTGTKTNSKQPLKKHRNILVAAKKFLSLQES